MAKKDMERRQTTYIYYRQCISAYMGSITAEMKRTYTQHAERSHVVVVDNTCSKGRAGVGRKMMDAAITKFG
jgi:hypothetical protein